jgi:hypothetical protein
MNLEASAEIRYRTPILKDLLKSMKIVYRHKDTKKGHVKLWLTSKAVKDELLKRTEIFLPTRRCRVTQPDLNREIRRCFKCQMYGHLLKDCKATGYVCGKCAGAHRTSACTVSNPRQFNCINCTRCSSKKSSTAPSPKSTSSVVNQHAAGERSCPEQITALERYKKTFGL